MPMSNEVALLDARGNPIQKSWGDACAEGSWRGPLWAQSGYGDPGNWFQLGALDMGFQRNLDIPGPDAIAAVFASVAAYAQTLASMRMFHIDEREDGARVRITTSALSRILRSPNEYQTGSDFRLNLVFSLMWYGNAYAVAFRNDRNEVDSLHLLPPRETMPYIDEDTRAVYYAVGENPMIGRMEMLIPGRDVLHVKLHTPRHPLVGMSPIRYAGAALSINQSIGRNQAAFFNNMSRPSGILSTEQALTTEQVNNLRSAWESMTRGMAAGKVPVLQWGFKWQPMTITSEDAQLIDAYKMSIEDIARVFRVPLAMIGRYEQATYSNTKELNEHWLDYGLRFVMEHIEEAFEKFFKVPPGQDVDFDTEAYLRMNLKERMEAWSRGVQSGIYAPNEVRAKEGLPAVEYGDEPRVQQQVVPLSQIAMTPAPPAPDAPPAAPEQQSDEERAFKAFTARQAIEKAMAE